ncbi:hypothetical protein PV726_31825 [Streptomyces europaeiscabiei]|uniref:hypothetical protein n=1 Tax=Streptomyces europaeiscabiei TaxID=146819 RepID=UPI0029A6537B|nr:hypothetical protein [Streptomyces europaeiscabiei]MDX3694844.1 hypothetical protein [Streptomyces europaeiscabiei]
MTLAAATGRYAPLYVACGLLIAALVLGFRLMPRRPFSVWVAWAAGAVLALLLAWASPMGRPLLVPWAGIEGAVGLILFLQWLRHRDGHLDWIVCSQGGVVLRREWSRRAAVRWARFAYEGPCLIVRADTLPPEVADEVPLYPDRELPLHLVPRPGADH